jgi:RNA polymerase sigma factor (sigma-70 family)
MTSEQEDFSLGKSSSRPVDGSVTELIDQYRNGNDDALTSLFDRYVAAVRAVARNRLDRRTYKVATGSEIANDVFVMLAEKMRANQAIELKDRDHLWNFLCALVRGKVSDERKRARALKRGLNRLQELGSDDDDGGLESLASVADSPELISQAIDQVVTAVNEMSELESKVLTLKLQLYSNAEICHVLAIPQHKLSRLLRKVRDLVLDAFLSEDTS